MTALNSDFFEWGNPADSDVTYCRHLLISIAASILLNFLMLLMIFSSNFNQIAWFNKKTRPKAVKEMPRLVLIERQPEKSRERKFLETDASQAVKETPRDANFYSEHNTVATQTIPSEVKSTDIPKADGRNTRTMATETALLNKPSPPPPPSQLIQPKSSPPEPQKTSPASEKQIASPHTQPIPKPTTEMPRTGEYALLKTTPPPVKSMPEEVTQSSQQMTSRDSTQPVSPSQPVPPSSNREVIAARSKLDGGVNRTGKALAFNSAESPFAIYDKKIIGKIGAYWHYLVQNKFYGETVGEVEITFKLLASGRITNIRIARNTANVVLAGWCLQAIEESAPFSPFPESMKALVGDSREGSITFAY